ncbi:hypothetical protein GCM10027346_09010 [Hymenobacter seoulensis]
MLPRVLLFVCFVFLAVPSFAQTVGLVANADSGLKSAATAVSGPAAVYHAVDEMPEFPGGTAAFQKFLRSELRYPEEALKLGISGKVFVRFIVTDEGRIRDAEIVKGLSGGLNEEALHFVRIMPWWTPGKNAGIPVWVEYTLPIEFRAMK